MKRVLLYLFILCSLATHAQVYNNEWIDYNKTYYKFKVGVTGAYRITQATLSSIGLGSTPAEHFQLWRNGHEVTIFTTVPTGPLGGSDYIEFWGEMNDGKPDSSLYLLPDYQLSDKWSLQTDTAAFFLTVNPSGNNKRFVSTPNNVAGNTLPPENYFMHRIGTYYRTKLNPGNAAVVGEYVYSSSYDKGEGWTSADIGPASPLTANHPNLFVYNSGPAPRIVFAASGNAINLRNFEVKINGDSIINQSMDFFNYVKLDVPFSLSTLSSNAASVEFVNKSAIPTDRMVVHRYEIIYPRQFNFGNARTFEFELPANTNGNYLEISNFNYNFSVPVLYDITNGKRYAGDISNPSLVKIALEPSSVDRKLVLVAEDFINIFNVSSLTPRNFINYSLPANQGNYFIISHPTLFNGPNGSNPVEDYRAYRSSVTGGSYNAKIYLIDDLVDQFGLGVKKHPNSIRNFVRYAAATFSAPPRFLFLVGKGVQYAQYRTFENTPDVEKLALIPTFGQPASDNLLTAIPGAAIPQFPVGRLSAINAAEVALYLKKVKEYEAAQAIQSPLIKDKAWMKNVVHIVGASDASLGTLLENYMDKYKQIISDTSFGANVTTFSKSSSDAVQQVSSDQLENLFEDGVTLLTYFGHSSSSTLEFNLDDPNNYNNTGKYPVFITLGCNAGNFYNYNTLRFITKETLSEKFVLAADKGTVGFIASTHFGIVHYLDIYNSRLYNAISKTSYDNTLGEMMVESIRQVFNITSQNDFYARFHCEQSTLHGDPAIHLNTHPKPDYVIEDPLLKISPSFISVAETSFKLNAKFLNIGRAVSKNIVIEVKRQYPNSQTIESIFRDTIPGIRFSDSISIDVPIVANRDKGLNKIIVTVDADNAVDELYETNNSVSREVFIYEDEARPVYPYNLAIINKQNIKLIASTANPFSPMKQYMMEMDTTEFFNSAFKITSTINSIGGILEFNPGIQFTDSTVYYWRVAPVPTTGFPVWNSSSFVYLPNSDLGFNQSHFFQHTKSSNFRMTYDSSSRQWKYTNVTNNLFLRLGTWVSSGASQEVSLSVSINGIPSIRNTNWFSSIVFNVLDPITFKPWQNQTIVSGTSAPNNMGQGLYGSLDYNPPFAAEPRYFNFEYRYTDTAGRRKMMNFMNNVIPNGAYVIVRNFTLNPALYTDTVVFPQKFVNDWKADSAYFGQGQTLYDYLKNAGLSGIDSFYRPRPFGLVYKKGDPTFTPKWIMGDGVFDNPTLSVDCFTPDTVGYTLSPVLGPAKAWKQLRWAGKALESIPGDNPQVDIIGVALSGGEDTLFRRINSTQLPYDISSINASQYPFLKLKMRNSDSINFTPFQMSYWRLTYVPVPEGAVAPNIFIQMKDTLEVGEPLDFKLAFKNISEAAFDSLKIKMIITDRNNFTSVIPVVRHRPLPVGDTLHVHHLLDTRKFAGMNNIFVEVNPDNDQLEQYHFNNFIYRNLYLKPDSLHPMLDVTFDGVHILNRDIVASKPHIIVKLKDEAKWMILDDTSLLTIQVRFPDGRLKTYPFSSDTLRFTAPGVAPNLDNTATIDFMPYFAEDGEYELIVFGKDKSDNEAGKIEYRVGFMVINKPMISNMLNYPNPFTTSTAFVFTITGSEVPQNLKIQIMTITGRIVREITKDELGLLHVGRNITEFKWDGTDQYGQKLANGIYLYRVVTNLNGKKLDKYKSEDDNTDKYFNKGYGKMYLMR